MKEPMQTGTEQSEIRTNVHHAKNALNHKLPPLKLITWGRKTDRSGNETSFDRTQIKVKQTDPRIPLSQKTHLIRLKQSKTNQNKVKQGKGAPPALPPSNSRTTALHWMLDVSPFRLPSSAFRVYTVCSVP
jgi:hypothetical protein